MMYVVMAILAWHGNSNSDDDDDDDDDDNDDDDDDEEEEEEEEEAEEEEEDAKDANIAGLMFPLLYRRLFDAICFYIMHFF